MRSYNRIQSCSVLCSLFVYSSKFVESRGRARMVRNVQSLFHNQGHGHKPEEQAATSSGVSGSVTDATARAETSTPGVSDDKYRNVAGLVTGAGALGWYLLSKKKKAEVFVIHSDNSSKINQSRVLLIWFLPAACRISRLYLSIFGN